MAARPVHLRVARDGADVVVQGGVAATVPQTCGRCLEAFPVEVRAHVDVRLVPRPASAIPSSWAATTSTWTSTSTISSSWIALVETETTLALPMKPLCREDCRGLCPACGGNRNLVACACASPAPDPRLAALRDLGHAPTPLMIERRA